MKRTGSAGMRGLLIGRNSVMKMEHGAGVLKNPTWLLKGRRSRQFWNSLEGWKERRFVSSGAGITMLRSLSPDWERK